MGLSVRLLECLSTRTSTIVYFVSLTPPTFVSLFKLYICFVQELMYKWFCNSSFLYLMNISILGISDAVNGCFREHTSDFIKFLVHSCPYIHFIPRHLKSAGYIYPAS